MADQARVSVIVPTLNRRDDLLEFVESLLAQTTPVFELLIVDAGEVPDMEDALASALAGSGVDLFYTRSEAGTSLQRNIALERFRGDYVLLCDDDLLLEPDYVERSLEAFQTPADPPVGCVLGTFSSPARPRGWQQRYFKAFGMTHSVPGDRASMSTSGGVRWLVVPSDVVAVPVASGGRTMYRAACFDDERFDEVCEHFWSIGGIMLLRVAEDVLISEEANARLARFVHRKIREIVEDPETAETLCPQSYPIGTKRLCVDTDYYATYNRDDVRLVDLQKTPIERITSTGVELAGDGGSVELDALVLATGFDAMTGALSKIDVRGSGGTTLTDAWKAGPRAYLGLMVSGFPNLFTITGPGSPSVLSNMVVSIEQHVDLIMDCLAEMESRNATSVEASPEAQEGWVAHVNEAAGETLMPKAGSWYLGANVPGKPRVFMPYVAGVAIYREICEKTVADGWPGFEFRAPD